MTSPSLDEPADPWGPFGLIMATVWLVFLSYPLIAAIQAPARWEKVIGVALTLAFAVIYVLGCRHAMSGDIGTRERANTPYYIALIALAVLMVVFIGPDAIGVGIFLIGFAIYTYRLPLALLLATLAVLGMSVAMLATDSFDELFFLLFIAVGVVIMNTVIRVSIGRGERYEVAMRELSIVQERERVARDVHDVLGHSLTVIAAKSELAERLLDVDVERARQEITEIHSLTREAISEVRATVGGLRVRQLGEELATARSALDTAGLLAAVPEDPDVVDPRNRVLFAWIVREAVTNIVRHSGASSARIELGPHRLAVTDNGRGIDGAAKGNGLRGLTERVTEAGGRLTLASGPDGGTRLDVDMVTP